MMRSFFERRSVRGHRADSKTTRRSRLTVDRLESRLAPAAFVVNSLADIANPPIGVVTLRSAIVAANGTNNHDPNNPDTVAFAINGQISLNSTLPALTGSIAILGPASGADVLSVIGASSNTHLPMLTVATPAIATIADLGLDGNSYGNGGISVDSGARLSVQNVRFMHAGGGAGGIANNGGTVSVTQSQFISNIANSNGGGIRNNGGALTVTASSFDGNIALGNGGGIYVSTPSGSSSGILTVVSCTFSNNSAASSYAGGGIAVGPQVQATIVNSTFCGNIATFGGGIAVSGTGAAPANLELHASTVVGNSATFGGGLYVNLNATAYLVNTIVAGNVHSDIDGMLIAAGASNLIADGTGMSGLTNAVNGNLVGTAVQPVSPRLGLLQNNGGQVQTMALLPGSPALDRGVRSPAADNLTSFDARGNPRVSGQPFLSRPASGDGRDIGAFELSVQSTPTVLTVNSLSDAPGAPPPGSLTLRLAIAAANGVIPLSSLPSSQVSVGSPYIMQIQFSVTGTIGLGSALPAIGANTCVALEGPGAAALTIVGDGLADTIITVAPVGAGVVGGLTVDGSSYHNAGLAANAQSSLVVHDSTIRNAVSSDGAGLSEAIGGLVTVNRSRFIANISYSDGAGISNHGGVLTVLDSSFDGNIASGYGGGIYVGPPMGSGSGILSVVGCTFSNNSAVSFGGGGIAVGRLAQADIFNCTFSGNNAPAGGGIAAYSASELQLLFVTVARNSAQAGLGGGFFIQPTAMVALFDTIVAGNSGGDVAGVLDVGEVNLIGDGTGMAGLINGVDGNLVGGAGQPINPMLGALANNGGLTQTMALLPGSPAINAGANMLHTSNDQRGVGYLRVVGSAADMGAFEVQAPRIQSTQVNDGSAQRSRVTSLTVRFDSQVTFAGPVASALTLTRVSDSAPVTFAATATIIGGVTVVTISNFAGSATQFGSLADGRYTLTALASQISAAGVNLASDYVFGNAQGLFRLFGDINGDRRVDIADFGLFSLSYLNSANYVSAFDFNGDGRIDIADFGQIAVRYLTPLP